MDGLMIEDDRGFPKKGRGPKFLELVKYGDFLLRMGQNHHVSSPFGKICLELFPSIEQANPRQKKVEL